MQTAVIPANGVTSLEFHWVPVNRTFKYYVYMHFSEVGSDLAKNQTREMYIYLNEEKWHGPLSPSHLETVTVYSTSPLTNYSRYDIEIRATDNSSLPPILNALEVYQVKEFPQLLTHQQDGMFLFSQTFSCFFFFLYKIWLFIVVNSYLCFLIYIIIIILFLCLFIHVKTFISGSYHEYQIKI